jgi:hypothetical protein
MVRADRVDSHRPFEICGAAADAVRSLSVRFAVWAIPSPSTTSQLKLWLGRLLNSVSTTGGGLNACRTLPSRWIRSPDIFIRLKGGANPKMCK